MLFVYTQRNAQTCIVLLSQRTSDTFMRLCENKTAAQCFIRVFFVSFKVSLSISFLLISESEGDMKLSCYTFWLLFIRFERLQTLCVSELLDAPQRRNKKDKNVQKYFSINLFPI